MSAPITTPDVGAGLAPARPALDVAAVRAQFPILTQRIHGKPLVYLDSAASAEIGRASCRERVFITV